MPLPSHCAHMTLRALGLGSWLYFAEQTGPSIQGTAVTGSLSLTEGCVGSQQSRTGRECRESTQG